jgi:hypothetical protein
MKLSLFSPEGIGKLVRMKTFACLLLNCAVGVAVLVGCASRGPKSEARIIKEGERNPYITERIEHAGEVEREIRH